LCGVRCEDDAAASSQNQPVAPSTIPIPNSNPQSTHHTHPNHQAIFLGAAAVSALATVAFVFFVPSHPNGPQRAPAAQHAKHAGLGPQHTQQAQQQQDWRQQAKALWRDVRSMGSDFYRTLGIIGLYGLGHINESLLEARAIEVG